MKIKIKFKWNRVLRFWTITTDCSNWLSREIIRRPDIWRKKWRWKNKRIFRSIEKSTYRIINWDINRLWKSSRKKRTFWLRKLSSWLMRDCSRRWMKRRWFIQNIRSFRMRFWKSRIWNFRKFKLKMRSCWRSTISICIILKRVIRIWM